MLRNKRPNEWTKYIDTFLFISIVGIILFTLFFFFYLTGLTFSGSYLLGEEAWHQWEGSYG